MENNIKPQFENLEANVILNHLNELTEIREIPHTEILNNLIEEIEPINFLEEAYPEVENLKEQLKKAEVGSNEAKELIKKLSGLKVSEKHHTIISVEKVIKYAELKDWGICKQLSYIYLYNGCFWKEINSDEFEVFLGLSAEKLGVPKYTAKYFQFRQKLLKQFLATGYLQKPEPQQNTVLINLQNGTFEITPEKSFLRGFNRKDFLTYQLPFEYNPEAIAPLFQAYLNKVLPDVSRQKVLAEYLGYVFIKQGSKSLKLEKALILYGSGANGKSVFYEIVNALLGTENTSNHTLQNLTDENGYYRAKIANKLVNYASEINGKLESSIFKQLVSGEPVGARLPYGEPFELKEYAKLIFNCNELPKDVEHTNAYFRRFLIIPFDVTIPEEERDTQLSNKIIETELSGVFNWVLEGLNRILEQKKFTECEAANKVLERYRFESDTVQLFLDEYEFKKCCDDYVLLKDIYTLYKGFCFEDGCKPLNKTNFRKRLEAIGINVSKNNKGNIVNVSSTSIRL